MFLSRVVISDAHHTTQHIPRCRIAPDGKDSFIADLVDHRQKHREYIVYHSEQAYPEYLIEYSRT